MKDKKSVGKRVKVLHKVDERQNTEREGEKCPS